jgi:hypothetical protein
MLARQSLLPSEFAAAIAAGVTYHAIKKLLGVAVHFSKLKTTPNKIS